MNNKYGGVVWTNHAIQRLYERQVTQQDAWYTFQHPDGQLKGSTPGSVRYYKDYGPQRIEVVGILNDKKEWVIMSCWSKLLGNNQSIFVQKENVIFYILRKLFEAIFHK